MAEPMIVEELTATVAEIVPAQPTSSALVRPAAPVALIEEAFADYQALCARLLTADDVQVIGDRSFRKKSAWRKLAVAFNVSTEILHEEEWRDEQGRLQRAKCKVRATAPNGRYMEGIGICSLSERKFSKPEHDIPATAMTRATNRACADLFGMGEVSAEEVSAADFIVERITASQVETLKNALREHREGFGSTYPDAWKAAHLPDVKHLDQLPADQFAKALNIVEAALAEAENATGSAPIAVVGKRVETTDARAETVEVVWGDGEEPF